MTKYLSKPKVFIICPFTSPNQGGVESHIQKLVKYISSKNRQVIISSYQPLTTPVKAPFYEIKDNYEIFRFPWFGNGLFPKIEHNPILTFLYLVPGLLVQTAYLGIVRRSEIGVVHAHGFAAGFVAIMLKPLMRKRIVMSTHAIYNFTARPLLAKIIKFILDRCDFVLAVGEPSLEELVSIGIPRKKLAVHPNWIDTDFFTPPEISKRKNTAQIIFVGRGLEKKGIFVFAELAKALPNVSFVARIGDGPDLQRFEKQYAGLKNLDIRTKLPSEFDQKMAVIREEYRSGDIFIMPSLYAEGFAAVVLEAASCGLAIISSNLGTLPSILEGSGTLLVEPTVENISKEIERLLNSPSLLESKKKQSRQFALKMFSTRNAQIIFDSYLL